MISMNFIPIFNDKNFVSATEEYKTIWSADSGKIIQAIESTTALEFEEKRIAVLVFEGVSSSGKNANDLMKLRASYSTEVKKCTLIHELSHRLLFGFKFDTSEDGHKILNLFLFDVWKQLYGEEFANKMVDVESQRTDMYKNAWKYALSMTPDERKEAFSKRTLSLNK